jgi:hypothetical protein
MAFRLRPLTGREPRALSVTVVRYTPQAVLVANVEEARYRALIADDGRLLVEARYAIRNNQRSFLKVSLPARSTVWSASIAGRPTRPGVAEADAVLLPLDKGRAGEEPPAFVVELIYFQHVDAWDKEGNARIDLPALDLPVAQNAVALHFPPRHRVELLSGPFRLDEDTGPSAAVLRAPPPDAAANVRRSQDSLQVLVDRFRSEASGRTIAGIVPVRVTFPTFGPSIFLRSELTAESQMPFIELAFKRKGGL